jgi:hypothetical protein
VTPITEGARATDPRWTVPYLQLAEGLVLAGAKARLIERFTEFPHSRVTALYRAFRGTVPPAGPITQGNARYFAVPSKRTSESLRIQCAIFLACYERMGRITATPLQRGWQLLAAFNAYLELTEKLTAATAVKRLDINQAYALLACCGFLAMRGEAELQRELCPDCGIAYPIAASEPRARQGCPVCAINANCLRLAGQASASAQKTRTSQRKP